MNLALLLDLVADTLGDRVALSEPGADMTYAQLRDRARAAADALLADGSGTLAFADVTTGAVPTALFGAAWAGIPYAPLNFRLPPESLREQLARLDRPAVVAGAALADALGSGAVPTDAWNARLAVAGATSAPTCPSRPAPRSCSSPAARRGPRRPRSSATSTCSPT